ncbi:MAG: ATP-binding protein [Chitinophagales bacterium]
MSDSNKIAVLAGLICGCFAAVAVALGMMEPPTRMVIFLSGLMAALVVYAVTALLLRRMVFRKIETIHAVVNELGSDTSGNKQEVSLDALKEKLQEFSLRKGTEIEQLKRLEKYRKEFLGNVSHELKTPIFNIQGYLETLLEDGFDNTQFATGYVQKASANADRLSDIVNDLLSISQYESGELKLTLEQYDFRLQCEEVFESFQLQAQMRHIDLRFRQPYTEPFWVEADKKRIREVISNLISNAIKYNNEGGFVSVALTAHHDTVIVEISDNGPGVAQEHLGRLFERFYRIDKARSRDKGGTGLGLAIVKHILEAHKQTIAVQSTVGIGTTFTFTLKRGQ